MGLEPQGWVWLQVGREDGTAADRDLLIETCRAPGLVLRAPDSTSMPFVQVRSQAFVRGEGAGQARSQCQPRL